MADEIWLTVPYAEKDKARALGARWNPKVKSWFIPRDMAIEPFELWLGWVKPIKQPADVLNGK